METTNRDLKSSTVNELSSDSSLGELLIETGKIKKTDVDKILAYTKKKNVRFGDAAIALRLVKEKDIKQALSTQYSYNYLQAGEGHYSKSLVAAYSPFSKQVEILRAIRSQLMLRHFNKGHQVLMITSSDIGEGKSYIAANLAVVFSQLGQNTLLIDANLRTPVQCNLFNLSNDTGLTTVLSERNMTDIINKIPEFKLLSILTSGPIPPNPSELLSSSRFKILIEKLTGKFDIILLDTSAASVSSDNEIIAAQVGAVMTVANKNKTKYDNFKSMIERYKSHDIAIIGSVLNKF